ncbi:MAG TPA: bifunctional methylenetetrahydrofolate dehydrogenase/methenyltetrahydrofolate cyclohydrolase FolD [Bacilli bacterium]|nr:bifunctional methylenetetrahydrofolate dehydrogenase/methenyltetrahydrofolate cyclohydrolase FolD [Bacilli bacterium]HPZ26566.1 bifunctional methylenetetrahydrofolate dehydrogenase/methenyltetrahydrofolate cyclohydrolase FolD [Bacilli bacterium]HQC89040.1 bifunctional methylenetetrahydrofolate dehydrogenase/methenyltetrahydrofolate cyclohydrolase FolD [Bacilli bacterium]
MICIILDGKKTAESLIKKIAGEVAAINEDITLALIMVGKNPASQVYVRNKIKACDEAGIRVKDYFLDEKIPQKELLKIIAECNADPKIHGILVQLPLPSHLNESEIINAIDPLKDVDGLTIVNQGKLMVGSDAIAPATPKGVITLLQKYFIEIAGKNAVVVGRSSLVGKPAALLLLQKNATVTIAHSKTANLREVTRRADILVVAVGKPRFITADMVKKDAVVVDVGINKVEGKIVGDVDFAGVKEVASYITPVPKGVGPMTIASLLENILLCYKKQISAREKV